MKVLFLQVERYFQYNLFYKDTFVIMSVENSTISRQDVARGGFVHHIFFLADEEKEAFVITVNIKTRVRFVRALGRSVKSVSHANRIARFYQTDF